MPRCIVKHMVIPKFPNAPQHTGRNSIQASVLGVSKPVLCNREIARPNFNIKEGSYLYPDKFSNYTFKEKVLN